MTTMADFAAHIQFIDNIRTAKLVAIVAVTSLLWHYLNTFPQEVHFIWKHPLRVNSILFLSVRYLSILSFGFSLSLLFRYMPSPEFCRAAAMFTGLTTLIVIALCDIILVIRVWAIYERRSTTLCLLILGLFVTTVPMFVLGLRWFMTVDVSNDNVPYPDTGCFLTSPVIHQYWEIFPFTIVFNSILFLMILCKSLGHYKLENRTPISTLLVRDGVLSYLVILVALLFAGFGVFIENLQPTAMQSGFLISVLSITCSQMQINLRGALASNQFCTTFHHNFYRCQCGGEITEDLVTAEIEFVTPFTPAAPTSPFPPFPLRTPPMSRRPSHWSGCRHHADCPLARQGQGRDIGFLEAILGGFGDYDHTSRRDENLFPSPRAPAPTLASRTGTPERRWSDSTIPFRTGTPLDPLEELDAETSTSATKVGLTLDLTNIITVPAKPKKVRVRSAPPPPRPSVQTNAYAMERMGRLSFTSTSLLSPPYNGTTGAVGAPNSISPTKRSNDLNTLTDASVTVIDSPQEVHPSGLSPPSLPSPPALAPLSSPRSQAGLHYYLHNAPSPLYGQGFISSTKH